VARLVRLRWMVEYRFLIWIARGHAGVNNELRARCWSRRALQSSWRLDGAWGGAMTWSLYQDLPAVGGGCRISVR
jgi:hypothetical protein